MDMNRYSEPEEMNDADEMEVGEGEELAFLPSKLVEVVKKALMSGEDAEKAVKAALSERPKPSFRITGDKPITPTDVPRLEMDDVELKQYESPALRAQKEADDLERKRYEDNRWSDSVAHHAATAPLNEYKPKPKPAVQDPQAEKRAKFEAEQRKQDAYESSLKLKPYER